jgi:REP element-mobilizing transposase RayT
MAKQLPLIKEPRRDTKLWWITKQHVYGGAINYRKIPRPFDSKKLTHAVLMGNVGKSLRLTKSSESIRRVINRVAKKYEITIKELAINHDHIHLLFRALSRELQKRFLRLVAAELGRQYKELRKKFGIRSTESLWRHRPFTRLVSWGKKSVKIIKNYIQKNRKEAAGLIAYEPRQHRLTKFLEKWAIQTESG